MAGTDLQNAGAGPLHEVNVHKPGRHRRLGRPSVRWGAELS
jgi:hypothetical protein